MDGTGSQRPLGDSQLDRDIESALSIEPSPEFLARARARIAAEPEPSLWRRAYVVSVFRRTSMDPLWGVALVGILMAIVIPQLMREEPVRPAADTAWPVEAGLRAGRPAERPVPGVPMRQRVHTAHASEVTLQLSRPVFSDGERRAVFDFAVAVEEGRMPPVPVFTEVVDQALAMRELSIEPLVIDPLPLLARVQTEGEGQW